MKRFKYQTERGLDSIGIVFPDNTVQTALVKDDNVNFLWSKKEWAFYYPKETFDNKTSLYHRIYNDFTKDIPNSTNLLFHHRKSSVGNISLENSHPFKGEKFTLMQNGTDKKMKDWWAIEGVDANNTDTYCILKFLELHANNLDECVVWLTHLSDVGIKLWVICVVEGDKILIYTDWDRELYIEKTKDSVEFFSSVELGSKAKSKCEGYMVIDFKWNILIDEMQKLNELSSAYTYTPAKETNWWDAIIKRFTPVSKTTTQLQLPSWKKEKKKRKVVNVLFEWVEEYFRATQSLVGKINKAIVKWKVKYLTNMIPKLEEIVLKDLENAAINLYDWKEYTEELGRRENEILEAAKKFVLFFEEQKERSLFSNNPSLWVMVTSLTQSVLEVCD